MKLYQQKIQTPLGTMVACANENGLCLFDFEDTKNLDKELLQVSEKLQSTIYEEENTILKLLKTQITEYFNGQRESFSVPLILIGTKFQREVWQTLLKIPYGNTISYLHEATLMGKPKSVRAVANANGRNKIPILIPCHRVIGANKTLTGYSGGIWRKEFLINLEKNASTLSLTKG